MRIFSITIFLFLLAALTIGVSLQESGSDLEVMNAALDSARENITNISLAEGVQEVEADIPNIEGIFLIIEKYVHFIGVLFTESLRTGVVFGYENTEFFTPEFLLSIMKLVVFALVVSLLIKPVFYILIFIAMFVMWLHNRFKRRYK